MTGLIAELSIEGSLPSMKNQRRLVVNRKTGRMFPIKSEKALVYEESFMSQVPATARIGYDGPVSVRARVWYANGRPDLDIEFLCDLIARAGIILNDRQITHKDARKMPPDKDRPRVEVEVYVDDGLDDAA